MAKATKKSVPAAGRRVAKSHNRPPKAAPKAKVVSISALANVAKEAWRFARGETNMLDALRAASDPKTPLADQVALKDNFFDGHLTNSLFRTHATFTTEHLDVARHVRGLKRHKEGTPDKECTRMGMRTKAQELAWGAARTAFSRLIEKAAMMGIQIGAAIRNDEKSKALKEAAKKRKARPSKNAPEAPQSIAAEIVGAVTPTEISSLGQVIHQVKFAATAIDTFVTKAAQNKDLKVPGEIIRSVHEFLVWAKALPSEDEAKVEEPAKAPAKAAPRKRRA